MSLYRIIGTLVGVVLVLAGLGIGYLWTACRAYVPPDKCLVLIHKTGEPMPAGQKIADEPSQKGIQKRAQIRLITDGALNRDTFPERFDCIDSRHVHVILQ